MGILVVKAVRGGILGVRAVMVGYTWCQVMVGYTWCQGSDGWVYLVSGQ